MFRTYTKLDIAGLTFCLVKTIFPNFNCPFSILASEISLDVITPSNLANENIIHTKRNSEFFIGFSEAFQTPHVEFNLHVETRQFTAACELVYKGTGSSVNELDAAKYVNQGLQFGPFKPVMPHQISLVRPITKQRSMVALEFMTYFEKSLNPFLL